MCENIRRDEVDVNKLVFEDPEKAIEYLHGRYHEASSQIQTQSLSVSP